MLLMLRTSATGHEVHPFIVLSLPPPEPPKVPLVYPEVRCVSQDSSSMKNGCRTHCRYTSSLHPYIVVNLEVANQHNYWDRETEISKWIINYQYMSSTHTRTVVCKALHTTAIIVLLCCCGVLQKYVPCTWKCISPYHCAYYLWVPQGGTGGHWPIPIITDMRHSHRSSHVAHENFSLRPSGLGEPFVRGYCVKMVPQSLMPNVSCSLNTTPHRGFSAICAVHLRMER